MEPDDIRKLKLDYENRLDTMERVLQREIAAQLSEMNGFLQRIAHALEHK